MSADLSQPNLALSASDFLMLKVNTTHIIHCAWAVNFALPLSSFEPQLASLQQLLAFSLSVRASRPAYLLFCSSIGAAMGTPPPAIIPAAPLALTQASNTGYSMSKLVAERIIENAVKCFGARATVLRIGQIVPSRRVGSKLWNPNEAIPLMVRSAIVLGALPDRTGSGDACAWFEVDVLAEAVIDLSMLSAKPGTAAELVYNLVNPRSFSWRDKFLPALSAAGLVFETIPYSIWLKRLAESSSDVSKNPTRKLLGFWDEQYRKSGHLVGEVRFDTKLTGQAILVIGLAGVVVEGDLVNAFVEAWKEIW